MRSILHILQKKREKYFQFLILIFIFVEFSDKNVFNVKLFQIQYKYKRPYLLTKLITT